MDQSSILEPKSHKYSVDIPKLDITKVTDVTQKKKVNVLPFQVNEFTLRNTQFCPSSPLSIASSKQGLTIRNPKN